MSKPITVTLTPAQARMLWRLLQEGKEGLAPEWVGELEAPSPRELGQMERAMARFRAACGNVLDDDEEAQS